MDLLAILAILLSSLFLGFVYSRALIDPDWAMFNLWGITGAKYGKDFLDCKSPAIHIWYLFLNKIVRTKDIDRRISIVRFIHHFMMGCTALIYLALSGDSWGAIAFAILINSGYLLTFHGNVGVPSAAALFLAMAAGGPVGAGLAVVALAFEPKLVLAVMFMFVTRGWWIEGAVLGAAGLAVIGWIKLYRREWWGQLWEANIEIPKRMTKNRIKVWFPWYWKDGLVYLLPWVILAIMSRPDIFYWLPALGYILVMIPGKVLRPNHLIPLIPWIAAAGLAPWMVMVLMIVDWGAAGLYLGDIWKMFYYGLNVDNVEAQLVGKWMRDKPGRLWVNGYLTQVYIYAGKPPIGGLTEQMEIWEVANERKEKWLTSYRANPPDWVVVTGGPKANFEPKGNGYQLAGQSGLSLIYKKGR